MPAPKDLADLVADLTARVRQLEQRPSLANTGATIPAPGVFRIDGDLEVTGSLVLPDASVQDSWLASLVKVSSIDELYTDVRSLPPTWTTLISKTVLPPPGMTTALVSAFTQVSMWNASASGDYLYCQPVINGDGGDGFATPVDPSQFNPAVSFHSRVLTDPASVTVTCRAQSGVATLPAADIKAKLIATVIWLR